ncbi:MAG: hypothetical protein WBY22_11705, partial [Nitrososphaeraceae archaeon]
MYARKIQSNLMIAFLAAVTTFSSSTFLTPALAQTGATQPSTDTGGATGADTGGATGADTGGATGADTGGATGEDTGAA